MLLKKLISKLKVKKVIGDLDINIEKLALNSLDVTKNALFIAVKGIDDDGNKYLLDAKLRGAVAVLTEQESDISITQIIVDDVRVELNKLVYEYFALKNAKIKFIGIVGTNGKTTTSFIIKSILISDGKKVGLIGTSGIYYENKFISPELTTPDTVTLAEIISDMANYGVEYVVMELSAHAIEQKRCDFIKFDCLIFTNCTEDHLDYFKDMENYSSVKESVFNNLRTKLAVVNIDDSLGLNIINNNKVECYSYGVDNPSDVFSIDIKCVDDGTVFVMNLFDEILPLKFKYVGKFNVYNCMAGATACYKLGASVSAIKRGIENIKGLEGRMEFIENYNGAKIFIDYAHTPDGLENTLKELKKITDKRLVVLFGCGGNREKEKRSKMGIIAGKYADFSILTSDNPRYEEPYLIISEIERGIRTKTLNYITIENRYIATGYAIEFLKEGDVLVVAGKGAENYQEIMGVKTKYSDKECIKDIIAKISLSGELI